MSMVGYVLGLGDRHPSNLMIERKTARVVHIDFGDCFEVARNREKFAECVPFRLTRMMINAMDVGALRGSFRRTCERIMALLRTNKGSIMAMLEAFVLDPLANWFTVDADLNQRIRVQQGTHTQENTRQNYAQNYGAPYTQTGWLNPSLQNTRDNQNRPQRFDQTFTNGPESRTVFPAEANREQTRSKANDALLRVEAKLKGREVEAETPRSVGEQVNMLIAEATSPENLSQLFLGWCPLW